ncbi:related to negative acting factor [Fusarium mangiferae]|uniref:Related to negative acting factor n=1 Tax=Fusarium mangiferae TaxID=192010 RepID=A0A1L7SXV4_FUSMA|nr:uncharacterized protein FMAN_09483 [Fusarium mangiferae]CVK91340.1 related to negative acting factor [Fusarium mangiferae]
MSSQEEKDLGAKCDLSRPACRQCRRAGSRCAGYRVEESVIFRDQTAETLGKVSVFSTLKLPNGNQDVLVRPRLSQQAKVHHSQDISSHYPWFRLEVTPEDQALHFFFHHYVLPESGRSPTHPDCHGIIHKRAIEPGYLANLINAVGLAGLAYLRNAPTLINLARQSFSHALRDICAALMDPSEASSDQMLVAVMLLALYETVAFNSDGGLSPWSRHVDGALALLQLRGAGQLRNRIGRSIFHSLRSEILINCLQRRLPVPKVLIDFMAEARSNETAQEAPAARLADIIVSVCAALPSAEEDITDEGTLSSHVSRLLSIDANLKDWAQTLLTEYGYKIRTKSMDLDEAEVFMGRHDIYSSVEIANTWNLQRCVRIIVRQALVETLSKYFPIPYSPSFSTSYRDLLQTSTIVIKDTSSDICCSISYILHAFDETGKSSDLRAAHAVHLLWPLYIAGTTHNANDALRYRIISTMEDIKDAAGIQEAERIALAVQQRGPELRCQNNITNQTDDDIWIRS